MKRIGNLYPSIYQLNHIEDAFQEVCRNTKNKAKVAKFKEYKCIYISRIENLLRNHLYTGGTYHSFIIYEPKKRIIFSQNLQDKVINHLISRHILYPALLPCLIDVNVASRKNLGTQKGLSLFKQFMRNCYINYGKFFILKCDISKFFSSIDHDILKRKLKRRIKDKEALDIVFKVIDSTNPGLGIGSMTSQVLAIFYLNDLDHFIKETLKIKYYVRYQDDFLLFHPFKEYLTECLTRIKDFLKKEKLVLNKKTRIYKSSDNFIFLGRNCKGNPAKYRNVKRNIKHKYKLYKKQKISLRSLINTLICYENHYPDMFTNHSELF